MVVSPPVLLEMCSKQPESDKTDFIVLTELWNDHQYEEISRIIEAEDWPRNRLVHFCSYFAKHIGVRELSVLHLFI